MRGAATCSVSVSAVQLSLLRLRCWPFPLRAGRAEGRFTLLRSMQPPQCCYISLHLHCDTFWTLLILPADTPPRLCHHLLLSCFLSLKTPLFVIIVLLSLFFASFLAVFQPCRDCTEATSQQKCSVLDVAAVEGLKGF